LIIFAKRYDYENKDTSSKDDGYRFLILFKKINNLFLFMKRRVSVRAEQSFTYG